MPTDAEGEAAALPLRLFVPDKALIMCPDDTTASREMQEGLYEDLRDPPYAAAYVNAAFLEGDAAVFKTAVPDIIRAREIGELAEAAGVDNVTVF